ncbi:MAG: hypothetical protein K8Q99_06100 [Acholeplasmataceae bacterium]|nr:hypothetical protein [Acholeplasmataceae bacterium]
MARYSNYSRVQIMFLKSNSSRNRSNAHQTRINKIRKIRNKVEYFNPNETWDQAYRRNLVKLVLMILLYIYSNDDGKVSRKELKQVKILLKQEKLVLNKDDHTEVYNLAIKELTSSAFFSYIQENGYEVSIFNDACDRAKSNIIKSRKYYKLLEDLKEQFRAYIE